MVWWKQKLPDIIDKYDKLVVIFGHPLCKPCQQIMIKVPIIYLKLKRKWYVLKFCNVIECKNYQISKVPTLIEFNKWLEKKRIEEDDIFKYLRKI